MLARAFASQSLVGNSRVSPRPTSVNQIAVNRVSSRSYTQIQRSILSTNITPRVVFVGKTGVVNPSRKFATEKKNAVAKSKDDEDDWMNPSYSSSDSQEPSTGIPVEPNDKVVEVNLLGIGLLLGGWVGAVTIFGGPTLFGFLAGTATTGAVLGGLYMYQQRIGVDVPEEHWEEIQEKMLDMAPEIEKKMNLAPGSLSDKEVEVHRAPATKGQAVLAFELPDGSHYVGLFQSNPGSPAFLRSLNISKKEGELEPVWTSPDATKIIDEAPQKA